MRGATNEDNQQGEQVTNMARRKPYRKFANKVRPTKEQMAALLQFSGLRVRAQRGYSGPEPTWTPELVSLLEAITYDQPVSGQR